MLFNFLCIIMMKIFYSDFIQTANGQKVDYSPFNFILVYGMMGININVSSAHGTM